MLQLLQYHVVPGMAITVDSLDNGQTLATALSGQTLKVNLPMAAAIIAIIADFAEAKGDTW